MISAQQAKNDFVKAMASYNEGLQLAKLTPVQQGEVLKQAAIPVRNELVKEWLKVDRSGLGGRLKSRIIIKQGEKKPNRVYIGPDWSQYYDFVWNILQWGWTIKGRYKSGKKKGQINRTKSGSVIGVHPGYRFLDKAMANSKTAFQKAASEAIDNVLKRSIK